MTLKGGGRVQTHKRYEATGGLLRASRPPRDTCDRYEASHRCRPPSQANKEQAPALDRPNGVRGMHLVHHESPLGFLLTVCVCW